MFLDLDNFKLVNDTLGHDAGDELLKIIAGRLLTCVRSGDTVCRQGGDEFIIVLPEIAHPLDAELVADKIIKAINDPIYIQEIELHVTTSIGIAVYPVNGVDDAKALMKKADIAMYETKNKGRNGFTFCQSS
jgi:diguanylate cyclase (GGDEF)-like protein